MKILISAAVLSMLSVNVKAGGFSDLQALTGTSAEPSSYGSPAAAPAPEDPRAQKPCYLSEHGCGTLSGLYIVRNRKWALKYGENCDAIIPKGMMPNIYKIVANKMCKDIKARYPGAHSKQDLASICKAAHDDFKPSTLEQLWGPVNLQGAVRQSQSDCSGEGGQPSWFTDLVEVEYEPSGEVHSGGDRTAVVLQRLSGDDGYKIYSGEAQNSYNIKLEVTCRNNGAVWKNETMSIRVDMPFTQTESSNVSFSLGASVAGLSAGASTGTNYSTPYGQWQELDVKGLFCGSKIDKEDMKE